MDILTARKQTSLACGASSSHTSCSQIPSILKGQNRRHRVREGRKCSSWTISPQEQQRSIQPRPSHACSLAHWDPLSGSEGKQEPRAKALAAFIGLIAVMRRFLQQATPTELQAEERPVKGALRTLRMATVVVPFASAGMGGTAYLVTRAIASFLQTYLLLLFLRVLLSWFPTFNWERQPWLTLRQMTDPYLQLFRGLIPPLLGMIDFTPLLGFFVLQWISGELQSITMEGDVEEFW